jgi:D-tyrosyl-tRNA(Tyr) deacylase
LLVFIGVERNDAEVNAVRLAERILGYRVFADAAGKMNLSIRDVAGALLLVPQFTLAADTTKGTRASFSSAAAAEEGRRLFELLVARIRQSGFVVAAGIFGADMSVTLTNEGPVTFQLTA